MPVIGRCFWCSETWDYLDPALLFRGFTGKSPKPFEYSKLCKPVKSSNRYHPPPPCFPLVCLNKPPPCPPPPEAAWIKGKRLGPFGGEGFPMPAAKGLPSRLWRLDFPPIGISFNKSAPRPLPPPQIMCPGTLLGHKFGPFQRGLNYWAGIFPYFVYRTFTLEKGGTLLFGRQPPPRGDTLFERGYFIWGSALFGDGFTIRKIYLVGPGAGQPHPPGLLILDVGHWLGLAEDDRLVIGLRGPQRWGLGPLNRPLKKNGVG